MPYSYNPEEDEHQPPLEPAQPHQLPPLQNVPFSPPMERKGPSQASTRSPLVIPADKRQPRAPSQAAPGQRHLRKYVIWYALSATIVLSVLLRLVFTIPLSSGQQNSATQGSGQRIVAQRTVGPTATVVPPQSHATPTQQQIPSLPGQLFSASSPWNIPIGTNVELDPDSSGMVSQLVNGYHVPSMFNYGMPIYISTASDPLYTVQDANHTFVANNPIHIPAVAAPAPIADRWMFIYDTTKNVIFEMWEAQKSGDTWTIQAGNVFSPTGNGVLQVDGTQTGGNGASYFGGVIRAADIQRGYINHALSFATSYTATTWRYPMSRSDGHGTNPSDLPMGARIQLDPSVNCSALPNASQGEKMVCQALETYGGYIRDTAGSGVALTMYFEGEDLKDPDRSPPAGSPGNTGRPDGVFGQVGLSEQREMSDIPWDKLRVLKAWNASTPLSFAQPATPGTIHNVRTASMQQQRSLNDACVACLRKRQYRVL